MSEGMSARMSVNLSEMKDGRCSADHAEYTRKATVSAQGVQEIQRKLMFFRSHIFWENKKLLSEICEPVDYIPEMIKADQLLTRFDKDHKGVKVVVDEFGGFVGIIGAEAVLSVLAGWWKK